MSELTDAQATLLLYQTARNSILSGKVSAVDIRGKSFTTHTLNDLERHIAHYEAKIARLSGKTGMVKVLMNP